MPAAELAPEVATRLPVDPYCWLVDLGAVLAETDRLLQGQSPLARRRIRGDRRRGAAVGMPQRDVRLRAAVVGYDVPQRVTAGSRAVPAV